MGRTYARSANSALVRNLVNELQESFVQKLQTRPQPLVGKNEFRRVEWLRDHGRHGGGHRFVATRTPTFNQAAVNVSGVHYDDNPDKKLASADALSTIIHPHSPRAPSVHIHLSWTEMRNGTGYFRVMADLNPAIANADMTTQFREALREAAPHHYEVAQEQGNRYFWIPALHRHRGSTHFYLEGFSTGNFTHDMTVAKSVVSAAIESYCDILDSALQKHPQITDDERSAQIRYHTLYLFQVLTLDRGTTSGLLVHNQNDVGIMGSLPSAVDSSLLASWATKVAAPQDSLVQRLASILSESTAGQVTDDKRAALAQAVRNHYQKHPDALALQAKGPPNPPTVANHN